jgi:hypothetical protein
MYKNRKERGGKNIILSFMRQGEHVCIDPLDDSFFLQPLHLPIYSVIFIITLNHAL